MGSFTLNFDKSRLITAANVIDNILYFTDNETEPKRINLEVFKAGDHSTGTTSVYGRQFIERDITVIRPHPQAVINSSLSQEVDVPIDAQEPLAITGEAEIFNAFIKLHGSSVSAGTIFTRRGFYYREYTSADSRTPTLEAVIAEGTEVVADLNGFAFSSEVVLAADKKYHYIAYAKTQIGSAVYGDVVAFSTNAVTTDFPSITTVGHEKLTNLSYKLKGKVTDEGGSQITEVGIYYYFLDFLNNTSTPSTLVGGSNNPIQGAYKDTATYNRDTGEFSINIRIEPGTVFYYQAYAVNVESGQDEGLVKVQTVSQTEAPALKLAECSIENNKAILRAQVTNPNGNLTERGFYFSKTSNNLFTMIATHSTNPNIFKVSVPMTANNYLDEFVFDTTAATGLTLARGETLYVAAYANNPSENQTGILPLTIRDVDVVTTPPSVSTNDLAIGTSNGNSTLVCTGDNNADTSQGVQSLGFYITRTATGVSLGINQAAKKAEMIRRINASPATAVETIAYKTQFAGLPDIINTDVGLFRVTFIGNNVVPIEPGFDYHIMATAFNGGVLGTGDVLNTPTAASSEAPPVFTADTQSITTTSGVMRGSVQFVNDPSLKTPVTAAGFTYAAGETGSLKVAFVNISSSELATLNNYIATGTGSGNFKASSPTLQANTLFKVQAFVEKGGAKSYAKFDGDNQGTYGDGITRFRTLAPPVALAKITASTAGAAERTTARIRANLTNDGGSNMKFIDMAPTFYYAKKSITVGSTNAQRIANIKTQVGSNAKTSEKGKLLCDIPDINANGRVATEVHATLGGRQQFSSSAAVSLSPNTEYWFFASTTVSNGAGLSDSNLNEFKTQPLAATAPIINPVVMTSISPNNAWAKSQVIGSGGNADYFGNIIGFYYVKKSDMAASYNPNNALTAAPNLIASSNKVFADASARFGGRTIGGKNIQNLLSNTEYYIIAAVENGVGVGYSTKATLFKTAGSPTPDSVNVLGNNVIWFDNKGRGIDGNSFDFKVTPSTATVTARTDDYWFPAGAGGGGLPRVLKERDRSGNTVLTVNCPVNNSTSQREIYIHLSHSITPGVTKKIKLIQQPGEGSPFGDLGFGGNNLSWLL